MDNIRIQRIQITKLFETINYDIDLSNNNAIAIITAPNGRGKTTLLNLISFVLKPSYEVFKTISSIPFKTFRCSLSNGKIIELVKYTGIITDKASKESNRSMLREQAFNRTRLIFDNFDLKFCIYDGIAPVTGSFVFSETLRVAFEMDPTEYLEEDDDDYPTYRVQSTSSRIRFKYIWKKQMTYLEECGCNIPVNYIEADRIQPVTLPPKRMRDEFEPHIESPLTIASEKISELIKMTTDKYNEAVSQAKDRLPQMFLDGTEKNLDCNEFEIGWNIYRNELTQFQNIGLIAPTEDFMRNKDIGNVYGNKGTFLSTYLRAFKNTTEPLKDIYARLSLLKEILDERNSITSKTVSFSKDGIAMYSGGNEIKLDTLSSGEKHDFIMFYNLIFNSKNNGLVLIDEPEISLHIEWQETYLNKLIKICKMNSLQAIVATHSPNIISSHYDFLVDKGEIDG